MFRKKRYYFRFFLEKNDLILDVLEKYMSADHNREQPEDSLFNSYYAEV